MARAGLATRTAARWAAALVCALLCLLALPAGAQDPYPPSPPAEPPESELTCEVDETREITCEGEGYLPGSTVTVEVRAGDEVLVESTVQVGPDGTFVIDHVMPCTVAGGTVQVRVSGRDSADRPVVETRTLEVPVTDDCDGVGVGGDEDVLGIPVDRDDDGSLAFTGRNLLLLLAIALVVLALGAAIVARRNREDGAA